MKHKHVLVAVVLTWIVVSFVPQLSAAALLGKFRGKG